MLLYKVVFNKAKNLLPILAQTQKKWQLSIHNTTTHMNNLYCEVTEHVNSLYLANTIHNVYWSGPHILLEIFAVQVWKINFLGNYPLTLKVG
jgi:hypothetical protein